MIQKKTIVARRGESIDEYYSRVFLEKEVGNFSGSVLRVESIEDMKTRESSSVQHVVMDRLLNREYEYERAVEEAKRILIPGGTILCVLSSIAPKLHRLESLWGFTVASATYIFGKHFGAENIQVTSFGNVFSGRMLLEGVFVSNLRKEELEEVDPFFPVIIGVVARKK